MKTSELLRRIKKRGCCLYRHGTRHDIWINPATKNTAQIPRHKTKELGAGLVDDILTKLDLK